MGFFKGLLAAIITGPLAATILNAIAVLVTERSLSEFTFALIGGPLFFGAFGLPISAVACLAIGVPTHFLLQFYQARRCWQYVFAGAASGLLLMLTQGGVSEVGSMVALLGAVTAFSFWWFAVRRPQSE